MTILTFRHIQCLHLMYAEIAWVLVSSGTQVQPQVILDPDYLPDYLSVSYDYDCDDFLIMWTSSLSNWLILNSTVNIFSNIFIITRFEVVSQFTFTHVASSPVAVHLKKIFSLMSIDLFWFYAPIAQCNDIIWMCAEWRTYHDLQKVSLSKYHSWNISRKQSQYLKITRQNDGSCE